MQKHKRRAREEGTFFHSRARIAFSRAFIPDVPHFQNPRATQATEEQQGSFLHEHARPLT